jgi:tellurite resistance protein TehA-like permease
MRGMENRDLIWIVLVSVIIFVLAAMTVPVLMKMQQGAETIPIQPPAGGQGQQPQSQQPAGREEAKQLKTAISIINLGLIIPLFIIYAGIYRRMKSSFTLGLMAVIFALGMYAITSNPLIIGLLGGRTGDIGLFQIIPDICATAALVILVRISLE